MRILVILLPLLALVHGDNLGYNYEQLQTAEMVQQTSVDVKQIANLLQPPSKQNDVHKQIFTFSPPETERFEEIAIAPKSVASLQRRLKIIFIRSPDLNQDLTKAIGNLVKSKAEQNTIIYVLQKQTDLHKLANKLEELKLQNPNKPEVHFVKYRTNAEAANAMQNIQTQYESLGGSTRQHEAELAPVINISSTTMLV